MRVLTRLETHGLVSGWSGGSAASAPAHPGIAWQLGSTGERLLRTMHGQKKRRRYLEPSAAFTAHTLATAELAVRLHELNDRQAVELLRLETEPSCWRSFIGPHGTLEWLKPDLYAITASGDYEDHWFLEADLATEHPPGRGPQGQGLPALRRHRRPPGPPRPVPGRHLGRPRTPPARRPYRPP